MTERPPGILAELGMEVDARDADAVRGLVTVQPGVCQTDTGLLRTSVLATWADITAGMVAALAVHPRIPLTLDLETQLVAGARVGAELVVTSRTIKVGRTVLVADARFHDSSSGSLIAVSYGSFMASPNPDHTIDQGFPVTLASADRLQVPLADRLQCTVVEPGVVEMPRLPDGQNATGAIQGGLVSVVAEEAALSLIPEPAIIASLNVRYFRPFNVGPARAVATRHDNLATIEITDLGSGRLGAIATVRLEPPAG